MNVLMRAQRLATLLAKISEGIRTTRKISELAMPQSAKEFDRYSQQWAAECLDILNVHFTQTGTAPNSEQTIFVGNHISYLDILLLLKTVPVAFVAKSDMASWPLFGTAAKVAGTVFVDRKSRKGRAEATQAISAKLKLEQRSVAIFPEGTTTLNGTTWRPGALRIAQQNNLPVQPFCLSYQPDRAVAYIDNDILLPHLWNLTKFSNIKAHIHLGEPRKILNVAQECAALQEWVQAQRTNPGIFSATYETLLGQPSLSPQDAVFHHSSI